MKARGAAVTRQLDATLALTFSVVVAGLGAATAVTVAITRVPAIASFRVFENMNLPLCCLFTTGCRVGGDSSELNGRKA